MTNLEAIRLILPLLPEWVNWVAMDEDSHYPDMYEYKPEPPDNLGIWSAIGEYRRMVLKMDWPEEKRATLLHIIRENCVAVGVEEVG